MFCLPPPAAVRGGTVHNVKPHRPPHVSYGKSVSTIPKASIGFIIRRVNRDAGGSMKPCAPGHGPVHHQEMNVVYTSSVLAVNTQQHCPHESGSSVQL